MLLCASLLWICIHVCSIFITFLHQATAREAQYQRQQQFNWISNSESSTVSYFLLLFTFRKHIPQRTLLWCIIIQGKLCWPSTLLCMLLHERNSPYTHIFVPMWEHIVGGENFSLRFMVVGMPNVGKSSLINALRRNYLKKGRCVYVCSMWNSLINALRRNYLKKGRCVAVNFQPCANLWVCSW